MNKKVVLLDSMKWKESIFIAVIFFGGGFIVGWHPTFESVRNFVIGGLSLGVVIEGVGLLRELYKEHRDKQTKEIESQNEKRNISGNLLSEIEINHRLLQPFIDFLEGAKLPNDLIFSRNVYSALSGKLGLISQNERDKAHQYYSELKYIEEEYKKLEMLHGFPSNGLGYFKLREVGKFKMPKPGWHEIEDFLRHAKKIYDLDIELIIDLTEKTGISESMAKEPLAIEHLQIEPPNIRKLWFDCSELKTQISKKKKTIKERIKNEYGGLPLGFEWKPNQDPKKRPIYEMLEEFYKNGELPENSRITDSEEFVEVIIKDKTLYEIVEIVIKNEADLEKKINEIEQLLNKIVLDVEKRRNELKDWYESLK